MFLKQLFPDNGWEVLIPACFKTQEIQERIRHDLLVEHFPWPGLRTKMLLSPLKFATNEFMNALRNHVKFTWNSDLRDMYTRDPCTGLYRYSDLVNARVNDMRYHTMGRDFFERFPELRTDIPCQAGLLRSLFPGRLHELSRKETRKGSDKEPDQLVHIAE